jgi:type II secretory pathway pseudopilin PulG
MGTGRSARRLQREVREQRLVTIRRTNGFALIDLIFTMGIIGVLCSIALPRLLLARQSAGAASAIGSLRAINSAQLTFALTCGGGFYAPSLTRLGTLPIGSNASFLSSSLTGADTVERSSYTIQMSATPFPGAPGSCNGLGGGAAGAGFKAAADPVDMVNNSRYFATNANAMIFEDTTTLFAGMPEVGSPPTGHVLK